MAETLAQPILAATPSAGLLGRAFGIIFSPRATYAGIVARPRAFGALLLILLIMASAAMTAFLSTEVGTRRRLSPISRCGSAKHWAGR